MFHANAGHAATARPAGPAREEEGAVDQRARAMIHVRVGELHVVPDPVGTPLDRQLQVDPRLQRGWNGEFPGPSPEQELRVGSRVQQAVRAPRGHLALRSTFHSDALRCTQMHSDALRCTQMHSVHSEALRGTQRHSEALRGTFHMHSRWTQMSSLQRSPASRVKRREVDRAQRSGARRSAPTPQRQPSCPGGHSPCTPVYESHRGN